MKKKGDLSIATSSIVWLIVAIVVLGLLITLAVRSFDAIDDKLVAEGNKLALPAKPTAQEPLTLTMPSQVKAGEAFVLRASVLAVDSDLLAVVVGLQCATAQGSILGATPSVTPREKVTQGSTETFYYGNEVLENTAPGRYLCTVRAEGDDPTTNPPTLVTYEIAASLQVVG